MTHWTVLEDQPSTYGGYQTNASSEEEPAPVRVVFQDIDVHAKQALKTASLVYVKFARVHIDSPM